MLKALLAALARRAVFDASCFASWRGPGPGAGGGPLHEDGAAGGMAARLALLRELLAAEPYAALLGHGRAELGAAALPSQRDMLQLVTVHPAGGGGGGTGGGTAFRFRLGLQANGCWMVTGIRPAAEEAHPFFAAQ